MVARFISGNNPSDLRRPPPHSMDDDDEDMADIRKQALRNSYSSSSAQPSAGAAVQNPHLGYGGYNVVPPLTKSEQQEAENFIRPRLNPLRALLLSMHRANKEASRFSEMENKGIIPKEMRVADLSTQIPASQPEIRADAIKMKNLFEQNSLKQKIKAHTAEYKRLVVEIKNFRGKLISDYDKYTTGSVIFKDEQIKPTDHQLMHKLQHHFTSLVDSEIGIIARNFTATIQTEKDKQLQQEKAREATAERKANEPEKTVQQQIQHEVQKALKAQSAINTNKNPSSAPRTQIPPNPGNGKKKKAKKAKTAKKPGNSNSANQRPKNADQQHPPQPPGNRRKGTDAGDQGQSKNRNVQNGSNPQQQSSNRK